MITIKQIAELAGVSRGTVDRVINQRGAVNSETEAKIQEILKKVNYQPNKVAKSLSVIKKNLKFGVILFGEAGENPFFDQVREGIEKKKEELKEYNVTIDVRSCDFAYEKQLQVIDELVKEGVCGIAMTPINHEKIAEKINKLYEQGILVVTMNTDIKDTKRIAYVGSNYYQSGRTAARLLGLITGGKANILAVIGSVTVLCHMERLNGFARVLKERYPNFKLVDVIENLDKNKISYERTKKALLEHPEVDALYLASAGVDGACRAVCDLNRQDDIVIISFDSVPKTISFVKQGIISATIDQDPKKQGMKSLDLLFDAIVMDNTIKEDVYYTRIDIILDENIK